MERANYPQRGMASKPPRIGRNVLHCIDKVRESGTMLERRIGSVRQVPANLGPPQGLVLGQDRAHMVLIPTGKTLQAFDVAGVVGFSGSDSSNHATGTTITCDGRCFVGAPSASE